MAVLLSNQIEMLSPAWRGVLWPMRHEDWFAELEGALDSAFHLGQPPCAPKPSDWLRALRFCEPCDVRVVITGQDPYHGVGQANGLAFSVGSGQQLPPSLRNIFREIGPDGNGFPRVDGNLSDWAECGVLLLNDVLTVELGQPGSHGHMPWCRFTSAIIKVLNLRPVAFLLWGARARRHAVAIANSSSDHQHLILEAPHPSPLSAYRGFFDCGHFEAVNDWLRKRGEAPVNWHG